MKKLLLFGILPLFFIPFLTFAQLDASGLQGQTGEITVNPQFPKPGETVTVGLNNFGSQLYNANITWTRNGQILSDFNNKREITLTAGDLGQDESITATVIRNTGVTQTYSTLIEPRYIDIIIEPQTHVPDWYRGRAMPSLGSQVNATVIINDGDIVTGDYNYTWRVNRQVIDGGPIRGGDSISFETPMGSQVTISVDISGLNGEVIGRRSIYFISTRAELEFYEYNNLYGQSHNAISNTLLMTGGASTIVATPYFMDVRAYNDPSIIEWEIDNDPQNVNLQNPYSVTLQRLTEGGQSRVNFEVRDTTQILQGARGSLNVTY